MTGVIRVLISTIDRYGNGNDLQGCNHDGDLWERIFGDFETEEQKVEIIRLRDQEVTPNNVLGALRGLGAKSKSGDFLGQISSTHGSQIADISPLEEIDGLDEVICVLRDNGQGITYISDDDFYDVWKTVKVGVRKFGFWDSCFAGGAAREMELDNLEAMDVASSFNPRYLAPEQFLDVPELCTAAFEAAAARLPIRTEKSRGGALVLSAAGSNEYAYETRWQGKVHGAGTVAATRALEELDKKTASYTDWHHAMLELIEGQTPYLDGTKRQRYEWELLSGRS